MKFANIFPHRLWLAFAGLLLMLIAFATGCKRNNSASSNPFKSAPSQSSAYFKTPFQTESQFIVENITADIAEMVCFAKNQRLPDKFAVVAEESGGTSDAPVYNITINADNLPPIKTTLAVSGPIWSEQVYADLTAAIAKAVGLASPASSETGDTMMLDNLTDGLASTIEEENLTLSKRLQGDFNNPSLHEQAAALLGAFALRENSGEFYDIRMPLCRMTAHMALARFFAGENPPGLNGRIADGMLLTLMNNEVAAVKQFNEINTSDHAVVTWVRVLQAYATRDSRPLNFSANVSGIERVAWFWAYSSANSRAVAWDRAGEAVNEIPDYSRIVAAMGYDVGMANVMLQSWLPLELKEIEKIHQMAQGRELKKDELADALNELPDRCFASTSKGPPQVHVIGWGLWSLQLQHHVCEAVSADFQSLTYKLGLPDDAAQFAQKSQDLLGGLRFYAFVRRLDCTNNETYRQSTDEGWAFQQKYPQLTPMRWMIHLSGRMYFAPMYRPLNNPHCNEWTIHNPLPGTAYDVDARYDYPSFTGGFGSGGKEKVLKVHEMAPYDLEIDRYMGRTYYKETWTYEDAMSIFGPMLPYSAIAGAAIADSQIKQPEQYVKTMRHVAELDPSFYYNLGDYEWNNGQTNEAVKEYEEAAQKDSNALGAARYAYRLITYYLAIGDKIKARTTADFAGEVYSYDGLVAKAGYFELIGDLPQAYEWYNKISERYNDDTEALLFCSRHAESTGDPALDAKIAAQFKHWVANHEKAKLADFKNPPTDGVTLIEDGPTINDAGVVKGDIVTAVRGLRVHNGNQLQIARDADLNPELLLIIWHNNSYREVTVHLPASHRLGVNTENYILKN